MTGHRTDRNPAAPDSGGARELVAEALYVAFEWSGCEGSAWDRRHEETREKWRQNADALLASPQFARLIAEAKGEALREAAGKYPGGWLTGPYAPEWMRECADDIERAARAALTAEAAQ